MKRIREKVESPYTHSELRAAEILNYAFIKAFNLIRREHRSRAYEKSYGKFLMRCAEVEVEEHLDTLKQFHNT